MILKWTGVCSGRTAMTDLQALVLTILIMFAVSLAMWLSLWASLSSAVDRWRCSMTLVIALILFLMGSTAVNGRSNEYKRGPYYRGL
jgi:hypothetical protein